MSEASGRAETLLSGGYPDISGRVGELIKDLVNDIKTFESEDQVGDLDSQRYQTIHKNLAFEDGLMDIKGNWIVSQCPHCDSFILHAPGTCTFCDEYPERQQARIARRTAFTGEPFDPTKTRCPSEYLRPAALINRWPSNRAIIISDEQKSIEDKKVDRCETCGAELISAGDSVWVCPNANGKDDVVHTRLEVVEAVAIDDNTENTLEFSQIVSVLANVAINLRNLLNDDSINVIFGKTTLELAESACSNGEALVEILRSEIHPPILFRPSATESVIVAWIPPIHDLTTEIDPPGFDGQVVAYIRPESVEGDDFPGLPFTITVNGEEYLIKGRQAEQPISYQGIVEFFYKDVAESDRPSPLPLYSITYKGETKNGILAPGQAIVPEPGMRFSAYVTNNA